MSLPHPWFPSQASDKAAAADSARIQWSEDRRTLRLVGSWTTTALAGLEQPTSRPGAVEESVTVDGSGLTGLDTAGALLIQRLREELQGQGTEVRLTGFDDRRAALLELVAERVGTPAEAAGRPASEAALRVGAARPAGCGWGARGLRHAVLRR